MASPIKAIDILHDWHLALHAIGTDYELEHWEVNRIKTDLLNWKLDKSTKTKQLDDVLIKLEQCYEKGKVADLENIDWIPELLNKLIERFIHFIGWRLSNAQGTLVYRDHWADPDHVSIQEYSNIKRVDKYSLRYKIYTELQKRYLTWINPNTVKPQ